jgi:hypothetical protein
MEQKVRCTRNLPILIFIYNLLHLFMCKKPCLDSVQYFSVIALGKLQGVFSPAKILSHFRKSRQPLHFFHHVPRVVYVVCT